MLFLHSIHIVFERSVEAWPMTSRHFFASNVLPVTSDNAQFAINAYFRGTLARQINWIPSNQLHLWSTKIHEFYSENTDGRHSTRFNSVQSFIGSSNLFLNSVARWTDARISRIILENKYEMNPKWWKHALKYYIFNNFVDFHKCHTKFDALRTPLNDSMARKWKHNSDYFKL